MWRVRTGSRLHLGLLSLPSAEEFWPDRLAQPVFPARRFGGVGLMLDLPGLVIRVSPSSSWSAEGPLAERALAFARLAHAAASPPDPSPRHLVIEQAPPEHIGLGTGTQLGLAVAHALARSWGLSPSSQELAGWVGRGRRSALGVHGFAQGGFLVEAGKLAGQTLSPLVARLDFPASWRVLFLLPEQTAGCHGISEQAVFDRLAAHLGQCEALCRLVLLGMLPALVERDLETFGEAVHDFNARVGEMFAHEQGGIYAGAATAELIALLRRQGVRGVGQSSWGPGVFAILGDEEQAVALAARLRPRYALQAWVARGRNHGVVAEAMD